MIQKQDSPSALKTPARTRMPWFHDKRDPIECAVKERLIEAQFDAPFSKLLNPVQSTALMFHGSDVDVKYSPKSTSANVPDQAFSWRVANRSPISKSRESDERDVWFTYSTERNSPTKPFFSFSWIPWITPISRNNFPRNSEAGTMPSALALRALRRYHI